MKRRPRLAIVGSGLSGTILADLLKHACELVLYERGPDGIERASNVKATGRQLGWRPFSYGIGGSTNLWGGGLLEMLDGEFLPAWPEKVHRELPQYYSAVVGQLYQQVAADAWSRRTNQRIDDNTFSTSIYYPNRVFRSPESSLLDGCDVRKNCLLQQLNEGSQGVELVFSQNGSTIAERFDYVILACGGINSPIPLLRSGLGGNCVGRNYTDHPAGTIAKITGGTNKEIVDLLKAPSTGFELTRALIKVRDPQSGLWSSFYLRPAATLGFRSDPFVNWFSLIDQPNTIRRKFAKLAQLSDPDEFYHYLEHRWGVKLPTRAAYVHVINEQEDKGQGAVTMDSKGNPALAWQVSDAAVSAIKRNLDSFAKLLGAELHLPPQPIGERLYSGAHHSGTCRISSNPAEGVVDENLLVHGSEKIYVCDGSVLPTTGATNTGLTIGALAHRLVNHLKSNFVGN